jgi:predicted AlkP superfamily pyrophosphatase or phosphodiesterase
VRALTRFCFLLVAGLLVVIASVDSNRLPSTPLRPGKPAPTGRPKLLVVLVVDQLRADYLTTFANRWHTGFRTLLDEGASFERAEYPYFSTVTCAGHSTIGTGTFPRTHGMVLNEWWHRDERRRRPCMDDEASPHISYGRPVKSGSSAKRLLVNTLADEVRAANPASQVVSLSLKARSAIGLAGHGGVVTWYDETIGSFLTSTAFANEPVKQVREFIAREPYERDYGQMWELNWPPDTYRFPDDGTGERPPVGWEAKFPHQITGPNNADPKFFELWRESPFSNAYLGRMALALIEGFRLGQDEAIDFLGVSFSALDMVGHDFGPRSREVEDLLGRLDTVIGTLIRRLDEQVGRDRYLLALTADHGVAATPPPGNGGPRGGPVMVNDISARIQQALVDQFGPGAWVDHVEHAYVYLAPGVFDRLKSTPAAMRAVERAMLMHPGVERVLRGDQLSTASRDPIVRAAALSHVPDRSGDLIVIPREQWFILRTNTDVVTHGTWRLYDRRVPVILFGAGVKRGRYRGEASPADIAPTLANVAGIPLPKAEGRVLREALR